MENTNTNRVQVKPNDMVADLWPLVEDEKKQNGSPAFANRHSLGSFILRGYHHNHIEGSQPNGKSHSVWVDKQQTIDHVLSYIDKVKLTNKVRFGKRRKKAAQPESVTMSVGPVVAAAIEQRTGSPKPWQQQYFLSVGGKLFNLGGHEYPLYAAKAALKQLGAQVFRSSATTGELKEVL